MYMWPPYFNMAFLMVKIDKTYTRILRWTF